MNSSERKKGKLGMQGLQKEYDRKAADSRRSLKNVIMAQKRLADIQILNKNLKKKISLHQNTLLNNKQTQIKNKTIFSSNNSTLRDTSFKTNQYKPKYTPQEINILNSYQKQVEEKYKREGNNAFEMALVQMIEKQQQLLQKRQKDYLFWKNKVKLLQQKYHSLSPQ